MDELDAADVASVAAAVASERTPTSNPDCVRAARLIVANMVVVGIVSRHVIGKFSCSGAGYTHVLPMPDILFFCG